VIAEGLPPSLSREARGNIAKIGTGLIAVMAQQDVCLVIFTACNAIDNNFLSQEDDLLQRKKQEEEELAQVLEYLSPANRAKAGFMRELLADDHPRSLAEVKAQRAYQNTMAGWEDQADDFVGSYSSVGTLIEAKQKSDHPNLRELDTRGRERARKVIYPHRRSNSPPRSKEAFLEQSKDYVHGTVVRVAEAATPEPVKMLGRAMVPYIVKGAQGVEQGLIYIGDHVPGAKVVGQVVKAVTVGSVEFLDKTLEVMPTAMRRTARTLGLPQNWAQNIGDATHLLQDVALIIVPTVRALRVERVAVAPVEVANYEHLLMPKDKILRLAQPTMVKHHVFNKFRGQSDKSQKYRDFFAKHKVDIDTFTVEIPESMHKYQIHTANNNWTTRWKDWIDTNPNATTKEVYQFAGKLMDEYGLSHIPLIPYK
jgi:hypothetical protein